MIGALKPDFPTIVAKVGLEPTANPKLLRQKIWALMNYVFYLYGWLEGKNLKAIEYFKQIELVIAKELETPDYHPSGTLAVLHFYTGFCCRAVGDFQMAERHFLDAQKEAQKRIEKKLADADQVQRRIHERCLVAKDHAFTEKGFLEAEAARNLIDRDYEIAYNTVFSARITGSGLGWGALFQGRLLKAEQLLRTALALLASTRQESLKLTLESTLWLAMRHRARCNSPEYEEGMEGLEACLIRFQRGADIAGYNRCRTELAWAYLLAPARKCTR